VSPVWGDELLIATNPDPESSLRYLLRLPLAGGLCFASPELGRAPRRSTATRCRSRSGLSAPRSSNGFRCASALGAGRDRPDPRPGQRESRADRVHPHPGPPSGVLGITARPQAGARPNVRTPTARRAGSPSWRSSSIPTSSTPTTSPADRSAPSPAHYPAATTASPSTDGWWPRSNASL
jgi:hypothetical protein